MPKQSNQMIDNPLGFGAEQSVYGPTRTEIGPMQTRSSNREALAAFLAHKAEIDRILKRLTALSAEHFNVLPEDVNWGHAGTLEYRATRLRDIADAAFGEGEYAD
jgi:hypothetical protein